MARAVLLSALLLVAAATPAFAQRDRLLVEPSPPTEWALTFGLTPSWDITPAALASLAGLDKNDMASRGGDSILKGSDWSIGFARGRALAGDWGISFVQQRYHRDTTISRVQSCSGNNNVVVERCFGESIRLTNAAAIGPEFHLNAPIVTIRDRVQISLALGGGIAVIRGTAAVERYGATFGANGVPIVTVTREEGEVADVVDDVFSTDAVTFLARIEPGVAFIVSPRVKVSVSAGLNYPGTTRFRIGATYFFPRATP